MLLLAASIRWKRVGDLVAETVVVKEKRIKLSRPDPGSDHL